jgi:hypothetical protein
VHLAVSIVASYHGRLLAASNDGAILVKPQL